MTDVEGTAVLKRALSDLESSPEDLSRLPSLAEALAEADVLRRRGQPVHVLDAAKNVVLGVWGATRAMYRMSADTWVALGVALTDRQFYTAALLAFDGALHVNNDQPDAWYNRGIIFLKQRRYADALDAFTQAEKRAPWNADIAIHIASVLARLCFYPEALCRYDQIIERYHSRIVRPGDAGRLFEGVDCNARDAALAWFNKGMIFTNQGRLGDALSAYEEAALVDPHFVEALRKIREIRARKGAADVTPSRGADLSHASENTSSVENHRRSQLKTVK